MTIFCGLIKGRHHLPDDISEFVFHSDVPQHHICDGDYMERVCDDFVARLHPDKIVVYVTGFTPAMLALVKVCAERGIKLSAYNYDRESRGFWRQEVL